MTHIAFIVSMISSPVVSLYQKLLVMPPTPIFSLFYCNRNHRRSWAYYWPTKINVTILASLVARRSHRVKMLKFWPIGCEQNATSSCCPYVEGRGMLCSVPSLLLQQTGVVMEHGMGPYRGRQYPRNGGATSVGAPRIPEDLAEDRADTSSWTFRWEKNKLLIS